MPIARFEMSDGRIARFEVPEGVTPEQAQAMIVQSLQSEKPQVQNIGASGFADALRDTLKESGPVARNLAAFGTGASNLVEGAKQIFGRGDDQAIQANRIMEKAAPVAAFGGNAALFALAPTTGIPAAAALGAGTGALQPTQEGESRFTNFALGAGLGAGGQAIGNALGSVLQKKLAQGAAQRSADAALKSVRDETLEAAQKAGYVVPASSVNPSWLNKRVESIAGKAAIGQEAAGRNQDVTNILARRELGLPPDVPLTESSLRNFRNVEAQPYRDVSALPTLPPERLIGLGGYPLIGPNKQPPAEALRDLQLARSSASDAWNEYKRTGVVTAKEAALGFDKKADSLEDYLIQTAKAAGKDDLVDALKSARTKIAKSFDVERALNLGSGNVDAQILGRMMDKGKPFTGELQTIAKFAEAFPAYAREGAKLPTPGVSKSEALASVLLGTMGASAGGAPGALVAALPLLSGPTRNMALSSGYQKMMAKPNYSGGLSTQALEKLTPERLSVLLRGGALTAQ